MLSGFGRRPFSKQEFISRMRARAGDPPRTMPQKILAGRCADAQLRGDLVDVKVDQVILSRAPTRAFADASTLAALAARAPESVAPEMSQSGILIARPGIGFPAPVHLERFGSPARLA